MGTRTQQENRDYTACAQMKPRNITVEVPVNALPAKLRSAILRAIDLVKRYNLPCDVEVRDIPTTAKHSWRKDGTCAIRLSNDLVRRGDSKAVHRRIIHEAAHHIAGLEHGHDEHFRKVAADLYQREGFPKGKPGDHCGNM
jgi:hypothetical protein